MFLWTVVGGGGSCILSCILCYPVHIQFGVVLRRPWSDNAKQHNERSLLILLGDGLRLTVKRSGWTGWFEFAVVVGSVQKPTHRRRQGGGRMRTTY